MIAGVCSGLARYLDANPVAVRIAVAVIGVFTCGGGAIVYAICVLLIPEEGKDTSVVQDLIDKYVRAQK
jgi:phage shock protein PspC (stress-responsive transcriptional regulator)